MNLYQFFEFLDKKTMMVYSGIMVFFYLFFRRKLIGLNVFLALFIGVVVVVILHQKSVDENTLESEERELKYSSIQPKTERFKRYDDILDFLFSIQDLYQWNPQSYEEMVDNIDVVLEVLELVNVGTELCNQYFSVAEAKKDNALNSLHAMVYTLPNNKIVLDKYNRAHKRLETILNKYLNEIYDVCYKEEIINGKHRLSRAINLGPKEYNHYRDVDKLFTYQAY